VPDIPILFEDAEALVIDKPAGLPVDRPKDGTTSLADLVDELRFGFARPPGIVHRLDRDPAAACCSPVIMARTGDSPPPLRKGRSRRPISRSSKVCLTPKRA
jgi:hypothetical protein